EEMRSGFIRIEDQKSIGNGTVSPISIDPLTWHILLILIATAGGYYSFHLLRSLFPAVSVPMMALSMLSGVALQQVLRLLRVQEYVDKQIITRMGSTVTDYLVAFGISSIEVSVVMKYATPLVIMV